jgi:microcystin-dependent protein
VTIDPSSGAAAPVPDVSPTEQLGASPGLTATLADALVAAGNDTSGPDNRPTDGAVLRYGKVTAVGTGPNVSRVQVDSLAAAWLTYDASYSPTVGDLVYLVGQGPIAHVIGKIGGTQPTAPPVGVIHPYAGATAPTGWLLANGQAVSRTTYAQLFVVCGTTFGSGDGSATFNVPNLTDRMPTGSGALYARGETGGAETRTLTTANLPSHSHTINHDHSSDPHSHTGNSHTHTVGSSGDETITQGTTGGSRIVSNNTAGTTGSAGGGQTSSSPANVNPMSGTSGSTGSGTAFNNMPPYLGLVYIIRALP